MVFLRFSNYTSWKIFSRFRNKFVLKHKFNICPTEVIQDYYNDNRRLKGLKPSIHGRTVVKHKSMKISVKKAFIWLQSTELIPEKIEKFNKRQVKCCLRKLIPLYFLDNGELLSIFIKPTLFLNFFLILY